MRPAVPTPRAKHRSTASWRPIVIVGAGRTGTNMLRDLLTRLPGFGTWPCDEINCLWRHGNARHPDDELGRERASGRTKAYIRRAFARVAASQGVHTVVEKTCANSLRVGFVDEVLPEGLFLCVVRDGRDVVASALKRWKAPLDLRYAWKKARFVPLADVPYYGSRFLRNRVYKLLSRQERLASWGPRFRDMDDALRRLDLAEVCALQWKRCVEKTEEELKSIAPERVYRLRYEDFVASPGSQFERISRFCGVELSGEQASLLTTDVRPSSVGTWRRDLRDDVKERVEALLGPTLEGYGYSGGSTVD